MRYGWLLLILLWINSFAVHAQSNSGPVRVELEARAQVFNLVPCNDKGIMVFYETINQPDQQNKTWFFILHNTALETLWTREISINVDFVFQSSFIDNENLFLVFQKSTKAKTDSHFFQLLNLNLQNGESVTYSIPMPANSDIVTFEIFSNHLILGLNHGKERATLLIKDLSTGDESTVKFNDQSTFIKDLKIDAATSTIYTALNIFQSKRESSFYVNAYNMSGQLLQSIALTPPQTTERIMNGQLHIDNEKNIYVIGTYNNTNGKAIKEDRTKSGDPSEGFYMAGIVGDSQKFLHTYSLLNFSNIRRILNNKQLAAAESLLKKQNRQNKEQGLTYDFLVHNLQVNDDELIIAADAFYPEYRQVSTMSYDFYGRPMPYYYTIFEGYQYFNAFVAGFNKQGELGWSNGIKIWEMKSFQINQKTEVFIDDDEMFIFYNHDGKIVSKAFHKFNDIGTIENTQIATNFPGDRLIENSQGNIKHWYGNNFVAYGYQTLQNNTQGSSERRKVFYMNKIALDYQY
ncbi:MAG TPA: hypothetical protein PKZ05_01930 [Bacteroidales bacterium]|nr:hypothetical protein [Bacteroidales bacterium]HQH13955.1 hypothetical protein [Bacteroidales bacterium]